MNDLPAVALQFVAFLFALSVHEAAHAWMASRQGDDTARLLGRVTLNPSRHVELFGSIIFPLMMLLSGGWIFGWAKPTPVDVTRLRQPRRDDILVTLAGPGSNLVLAVLALGLLRLLLHFQPQVAGDALNHLGHPQQSDSLWTPLTNLAFYSMEINLILAIFNLIPIPPLDGSHVARHLLPRAWRGGYYWLLANPMVSLLLLLAVVYANIPGMMYAPVLHAFEKLL